MGKRNFDKWLESMQDTLTTWDYYVDFEKVYKNVDAVKIELNILNSLIGSKNIKKDFENLCKSYPEVLKVIPLLLAVRQKEIQIIDCSREIVFDFSKEQYTVEEYSLFLEKSGLFDLISNHIVSNLIDYVLGIEVGLDSNARKNRTGKTMEKLVEDYLVDMGLEENKTYFKQISSKEIEKKFNLDLSPMTNKKKTPKVFDFAFVKNDKVYGCEVNFYNTSGSKLNETARSYKDLALEALKVSNFQFIWITDGKGWNQAKKNLEEVFDVLDYLFNLKDLEDGELKKL